MPSAAADPAYLAYLRSVGVEESALQNVANQRVSALTKIQVDGQGNIFVPYAGKIKAGGLSPDLAARLLMPKEDAAIKQVADTHQRLVLALNGIEPPDSTLPGGDPEMQTQIIKIGRASCRERASSPV